MQISPNNFLALDVGNKRIGVAIANEVARLPRPLTTLNNDGTVWDQIKSLIRSHEASTIVVGLPRGLEGQETEQTTLTREFVEKLKTIATVDVFLQDEALTSHQAETELAKAGKIYDKSAIDALAATYILEDFLNNQSVKTGEQR